MLVFEDLRDTARRRLFRLLGVEWTATSYAWISLPFFALLGIVVVLVSERQKAGECCLLLGLGYGFLLFLVNTLHSIGHITSAAAVGAPMKANLITATFHVNLYLDDQDHSRRVHIGRALGGPVINLLVGLTALGIWVAIGGKLLLFFGRANLAVSLWTLFPIPQMDGWVIWGTLLKSSLRRFQ